MIGPIILSYPKNGNYREHGVPDGAIGVETRETKMIVENFRALLRNLQITTAMEAQASQTWVK